jgi:hypothetical protein
MSETPHIPFNTSANPRTKDLAKNTLYQNKNKKNKKKLKKRSSSSSSILSLNDGTFKGMK